MDDSGWGASSSSNKAFGAGNDREAACSRFIKALGIEYISLDRDIRDEKHSQRGVSCYADCGAYTRTVRKVMIRDRRLPVKLTSGLVEREVWICPRCYRSLLEQGVDPY